MTDSAVNQFTMGSAYQFSIRAKLFILVLSVVMPMLGLFTYHIYDEIDQSMAAATGRLDIISEHTAKDISRLLGEHGDVLARLAQQPLIRSLDARSCHPIMTDYVLLRDLFTSITIRDIHGNAVCSTNPNPPSAEKILSYTWFQAAIRSDKYLVSDAIRGSSSKRWVAPLTYPIHNEEDGMVGVLILGLDLLKLNARLFELSHANQYDAFLLSSISPELRIGQSLNDDQILATGDLNSGYFFMSDAEENRSLFAARTVPGTGW